MTMQRNRADERIARRELKSDGQRERKNNLQSNCVMPHGSKGLQRDTFSFHKSFSRVPSPPSSHSFTSAARLSFPRVLLLQRNEMKSRHGGTQSDPLGHQKPAALEIEHVGEMCLRRNRLALWEKNVTFRTEWRRNPPSLGMFFSWCFHSFQKAANGHFTSHSDRQEPTCCF